MAKHYEFFLEGIEEMQSKMKHIDGRFSMLNLILENRNVSEDEMLREKLADLINRSKEITNEDAKINFEEKNTVEVFKYLEESFNEKLKTFKLKRQFMENIKKMKDTQKNDLSKLFDKLNALEDDYVVVDRFLTNIKSAIKQNTEEVKSLTAKIKQANDERGLLEQKNQSFEKEVKSLNEQINQQGDFFIRLNAQFEENKALISQKILEIEGFQAKVVAEKIMVMEQEERIAYVDQVAHELAKEVDDLLKTKQKKEQEASSKLTGLKEGLKNKSKSEEEIKKAEAIIRMIEKGESLKQSLLDLKDDQKNLLIDLVSKTDNMAQSKQTFAFYEQMIADFVSEKDTNLNHLIGLTISSHLSHKDKIIKITQIYRDRNVKLIDFLTNLLLKVNTLSLRNYFNFVLNSNDINIEKLVLIIKSSSELLDDVFNQTNSTKNMENGTSLKLAISLSKTLEESQGMVVGG